MSRAGALFSLLVVLSFSVWAQGDCRSFRECYELGRRADRENDLPLALRAFSNACSKDVKRSLIALKFSACLQLLRISETFDDYSTARTFFEDQCHNGVQNGCFFLGKLEEDQGNLERAMEIMKPLCRQDFSNPSVFGYGGCDALESLHRKWESLHPDPPRKSRKGPLQIAAFFSVFVFVFVSLAFVGWSYMKKSRTAVWALLSPCSGLPRTCTTNRAFPLTRIFD